MPLVRFNRYINRLFAPFDRPIRAYDVRTDATREETLGAGSQYSTIVSRLR